jgi:hypothetical protein
MKPRTPGKKPIHPQYFARMIDEVAAEDTINFGLYVGGFLSMRGGLHEKR